MEYNNIHSWEISPMEARELQLELKGMVREKPFRGPPKLVAGADVAYSRAGNLVFAVAVVMDPADYSIVEEAMAVREGSFPYIPGLLSFREGPAVIEAFSRLETRPDLVFFDGQGVAHPRRLGLAAHMGLFLDIPSIGAAKSRLTGSFEEPPQKRGGQSPLMDRGEVIGAVVRTRSRVRPLFISVGHLIDLPSAVEQTLDACRRYRLPEPTRAAHNLVTRLKAEILGGGTEH